MFRNLLILSLLGTTSYTMQAQSSHGLETSISYSLDNAPAFYREHRRNWDTPSQRMECLNISDVFLDGAGDPFSKLGFKHTSTEDQGVLAPLCQERIIEYITCEDGVTRVRDLASNLLNPSANPKPAEYLHRQRNIYSCGETIISNNVPKSILGYQFSYSKNIKLKYNLELNAKSNCSDFPVNLKVKIDNKKIGFNEHGEIKLVTENPTIIFESEDLYITPWSEGEIHDGSDLCRIKFDNAQVKISEGKKIIENTSVYTTLTEESFIHINAEAIHLKNSIEWKGQLYLQAKNFENFISKILNPEWESLERLTLMNFGQLIETSLCDKTIDNADVFVNPFDAFHRAGCHPKKPSYFGLTVPDDEWINFDISKYTAIGDQPYIYFHEGDDFTGYSVQINKNTSWWEGEDGALKVSPENRDALQRYLYILLSVKNARYSQEKFIALDPISSIGPRQDLQKAISQANYFLDAFSENDNRLSESLDALKEGMINLEDNL